MSFLVGFPRRVLINIKNASGSAYDPPSGKLSVTVLKPTLDRSVYVYPTDPQIVRDSLGQYHIDVTGNIAGTFTVAYKNIDTGNTSGDEIDIVFRNGKVG